MCYLSSQLATLSFDGPQATAPHTGKPSARRYKEGTTGMVRAFRLDNGTQAWYKAGSANSEIRATGGQDWRQVNNITNITGGFGMQ